MHMKDDPLGRAWVEIAQANPDFLAFFRRILLAFHSTDANIKIGTAGTGFIIGDTPEWLFFLSAKHVISEGILKLQNPYARFDTGPFNTSSEFHNVRLGGRLKVSVLSDDNAFLADVVYLSANSTTDVVIGIAEIPSEFRTNRFWHKIPLAVVLPNVGDSIHICSLINRMPVENESTQKGRSFQIERGVTIRKGVVTNVYPRGLNQYKWACFTTSIPAVPGMSGGFAYSPTDGEPIAACGIVCAELSGADGSSYFDEGQSLIACSWLALANSVPSKISKGNAWDNLTLYELTMNGQFPKPLGDFHRVQFRRESADDVFIGIK